MEAPRRPGYLERMDSETRAAFATQGAAIAALSETMTAGFARVDRYFELQQKQLLEWRDELRGEIREVRERVDALTERMGGLEHEVASLRDYVTREITEIRLVLRELRARPGQTEELRREISELTARVERLEGRQSD